MKLPVLRELWRHLRSEWRKAPLCFSLAALSAGGVLLSLLLFLCCGTWLLSAILVPVAEHLNPGIDAPDNWALGVTYWLYSMMVLGSAVVVFLAAAFWQVYRKTRRDMVRPTSAPPGRSGGGVQERA
ncbi:MAG: hypothetical protein ACYTFI_23375 [Planctomycetota bacterium]|jgi:hypothetical protein